MVEEFHIQDDEPNPAELADGTEAPAPGRAERLIGNRFVPVAARALALAGFASLLLCDGAPTRTVSVSFV